MIWKAFAFPFGLLVRRAGMLLPWLAGCWVILFAIDCGFTIVGVDLVFDDTNQSPGYTLAGALPILFTSGAILASALIDVGERSEDRPPNFGDGRIYFICGLIWIGLAIAPAALVGGVAAAIVQAAVVEPWRQWTLYAIAALAALFVVSITVRMAFQTPLSIARGQALGYSVLPETRGRAVKLSLTLLILWGAGMAALVLGIAGLFWALGPYFAEAPEISDPGIMFNLGYLALFELAQVFSILWILATLVYVFHRLRTRLTEATAP